MNKFLLAISILIIGIYSHQATTTAIAQGISEGLDGQPPKSGTFGKFEVGLPGIPKDTTIDEYVNNPKPIVRFINTSVNVVIALLVIIGLISITIGGYLYMTAAGNGKQIGTAKEIIIAALAGIFLALISVVILNTVNRYLGEAAKEPTLGPAEGSALDSPSGAIDSFDDSGSFGSPDNLPTF